ncbi:MAG TPA: hypothetical protein VGS80_15685 [Ktedonobacterales bacterium]|jgi:hypothetical protein|nr:hypothetical protein [Ktedonobacterales bacterium]
MVYHGDPDLIWIQEAPDEYGPTRSTLDRLIADGTIHDVRFVGDKRVYLRRSELDRVLGKPIKDVPGHENASHTG